MENQIVTLLIICILVGTLLVIAFKELNKIEGISKIFYSTVIPILATLVIYKYIYQTLGEKK